MVISKYLLLECRDAILSALTSIINDSLLYGIFPSMFKSAIVTPLLKKTSLDPNDLKNYRPVFNLSFLFQDPWESCFSPAFFSDFQPAYRLGHSTDTTLLEIVKDLLTALDNGMISVLTLLDLSGTCDTIDHDILLHCLQHVYGIHDTALAWFESYLTNRNKSSL